MKCVVDFRDGYGGLPERHGLHRGSNVCGFCQRKISVFAWVCIESFFSQAGLKATGSKEIETVTNWFVLLVHCHFNSLIITELILATQVE